MADKATTVEEQISQLAIRGMKLGDKDKAKENLLDIGYYRLGFYWFPFEKSYPKKHNRDHNFKEGTEFDYAIKLYYKYSILYVYNYVLIYIYVIIHNVN